MPRMHYARLANSPRQQRVLRVLSDGQEHSTRDIITRARVCAVNSIVAELRCNGIGIITRQAKRVWFYRLGFNAIGEGPGAALCARSARPPCCAAGGKIFEKRLDCNWITG